MFTNINLDCASKYSEDILADILYTDIKTHRRTPFNEDKQTHRNPNRRT